MQMRNYYIFIGFLGILVFTVVLLGLTIVGNPFAQRDKSFDNTRLSDFGSIRYEIEKFFSTNYKLPNQLTDLKSKVAIKDPKTRKDYDYIVLNDKGYKLCTDFSTDSNDTISDRYSYPSSYYDQWKHKKGYDCIEYTVPDFLIRNLPTPTLKPPPMKPPQLVAYWPFDSDKDLITAYDMSGNNNISGSTSTVFTTGKIGKARLFNGWDSSIWVSNKLNFSFERTNPFTIESWIKYAETDKESTIFSKMENEHGNRGYEFFINKNNQLGVYLINTWSDNAIYVYGQTPVNNNLWHHVAMTYDGSSKAQGVKIYLDGKEQLSNISVDSLKDGIQNDVFPNIGSRAGGNYIYNGIIDEVRIYNYALTPDKVLTDMSGNYTEPTPSISPAQFLL
ncbi:LamG domain-containing protein [Candidatus Gottesmanbacteria bacterium]|nr:LamG domain-containing protein [Candidatus Gottesmanbacteria bacterium]